MRLGISIRACLSTPVTQVVHRDDLPPARFVQVGQERAYNSTSKVSNMEGLCDVG